GHDVHDRKPAAARERSRDLLRRRVLGIEQDRLEPRPQGQENCFDVGDGGVDEKDFTTDAIRVASAIYPRPSSCERVSTRSEARVSSRLALKPDGRDRTAFQPSISVARLIVTPLHSPRSSVSVAEAYSQ